jgi:hypothetical protein
VNAKPGLIATLFVVVTTLAAAAEPPKPLASSTTDEAFVRDLGDRRVAGRNACDLSR